MKYINRFFIDLFKWVQLHLSAFLRFVRDISVFLIPSRKVLLHLNSFLVDWLALLDEYKWSQKYSLWFELLFVQKNQVVELINSDPDSHVDWEHPDKSSVLELEVSSIELELRVA